MVTFTCFHCGDSVKKNQVEKHYSFKRCARQIPALTCVDCLKDFPGEEYIAHTSCVSELEKYSPKGYVAKNTGMKKQEMWINAVNDYLNSGVPMDNKVRNIVLEICNNPGLPQKKAKFMNFCRSHVGTKKAEPSVLQSVWEVLEKVKMQLRNQNSDNLGNNTDCQEDRKRKRVDSGNEPSINGVVNPDRSVTKNSNSATSKLRKKQKSNTIPLSEEPEESNGVEEGKNSIKFVEQCEDVDRVSGKIKSKKQRKSQQTGELEHIVEEQSTTLNGSVDNSETVKLSKKERKQKLKREKYEKELKEVENEVSDKVIDDNYVEETDDKKKKKKKNKVNSSYTNEISELESHEELEVRRKKNENKNAESQEEQENEITVDVAISKPSKFNWEEIIIKVLEAKGELPLKRLEKKVVNEYLNHCEHSTTIEEVISKFNKKVLKIPRVKVKKEVAKLIS